MPIAPLIIRRLPGAERRRDPRSYVRQAVTVEADGRQRLCRTIEMSCGGARIAYDARRWSPPAGPYLLAFDRGQAGPLQVTGVLAWQLPHCFGVQFLQTSDVERLAIAEIIDRATQQAA